MTAFLESGFTLQQVAEAWRESLLQVHVEVARQNPEHPLSADIIADESSVSYEKEAFNAKYVLENPEECELFECLHGNIEYLLGIPLQEDDSSSSFEDDDDIYFNDDEYPDLYATSRAESDWQNWRGF